MNKFRSYVGAVGKVYMDDARKMFEGIEEGNPIAFLIHLWILTGFDPHYAWIVGLFKMKQYEAMEEAAKEAEAAGSKPSGLRCPKLALFLGALSLCGLAIRAFRDNTRD